MKYILFSVWTTQSWKMAKYCAKYAWALKYNSRTCFAESPRYIGTCARIRLISSDSHALPKIAQPSIWQSIVPRAIRNRFKHASDPNKKKRAPNPATYFIWIYLLIGSQAIRILQIQNDFNTFVRRADIKIGKLRDVVEALQRGEEVDVEKALGTGDEVQEREWEEAIREIEEEDRLWQSSNQKKRQAREEGIEESARKADENSASAVDDDVDERVEVEKGASSGQDCRRPAPGFY